LFLNMMLNKLAEENRYLLLNIQFAKQYVNLM